MKKTITFFLCIIGMMVVSAQIPNNDFENWSNGPNAAPDGWSSDTGGSFHTVIRSTDHFSGNYSAEIQNQIIGTDTFNGKMMTGSQNQLGQGLMPTYPVNQRHTSLKGYY